MAIEKPWAVIFNVKHQNMEVSASVMACNCDGSHIMLHSEVILYSP